MTPAVAPFLPCLPLSIATVALAFSILFHAIIRPRKDPTMVSPDVQALADSLAAAIAAFNSRPAPSDLQPELDAANAALATEKQNHTDDVAALEAQLTAAEAALKAATPGAPA